MKKEERPDLSNVMNYTIVALIGMLAGIIIGSVFCQGDRLPSGGTRPLPAANTH